MFLFDIFSNQFVHYHSFRIFLIIHMYDKRLTAVQFHCNQAAAINTYCSCANCFCSRGPLLVPPEPTDLSFQHKHNNEIYIGYLLPSPNFIKISSFPLESMSPPGAVISFSFCIKFGPCCPGCWPGCMGCCCCAPMPIGCVTALGITCGMPFIPCSLDAKL